MIAIDSFQQAGEKTVLLLFQNQASVPSNALKNITNFRNALGEY